MQPYIITPALLSLLDEITTLDGPARRVLEAHLALTRGGSSLVAALDLMRPDAPLKDHAVALAMQVEDLINGADVKQGTLEDVGAIVDHIDTILDASDTSLDLPLEDDGEIDEDESDIDLDSED